MNRTAPFPTRADIARFLREEREAGRDPGKREVARAFGVTAGGKIWLKKILKEIEAEGDAAPRADAALDADASRLPAVLLIDCHGRDGDGELVARPADWDEEARGPAPLILVLPAARGRSGETVTPGVGDRALVKLVRRGAHYEARPLKVLARQRPAVIGVYRADRNGGGRIQPVEKKGQGRELLVRPGDEAGAQDGDLVTVSVLRSGYGLSRAKVKERLGAVSSEKAVSLIAIHAHGIPVEFSAAALREAEAARPATMEGREDWRGLPLVTIDPPDAKDHDDAVHAAPDDDPKNPGGFVLTVAIADVGAYVRPGSAMDREAEQRGNSVYFPDRVVPMLPERISNDLCSLKPLVDRPAIAARITIAADGRKLRHSFHRVMMRSAAKLAYAQAQAAVDGRPDETTAPLLDVALKPLWAAYAALKGERRGRQPLDLDLPERKLLIGADGKVERVTIPERLDAHRLIEEFMILANVCAAETLERAPSGLLYRVHDEPSVEKMRALSEVLASIGQKLPKAGALQPALFNRILAGVRGTENETFINEVVLRSRRRRSTRRRTSGISG